MSNDKGKPPLIDFEVRCVECDSSLAGMSVDQTCPKCGLPLAATVDPSKLDPDTLLINQDVACVSCNYNLRSLPVSSCCPECGATATKSLRSADLRCANSEWLERIELAAKSLLFMSLGPIVALLVWIFSKIAGGLPTNAALLVGILSAAAIPIIGFAGGIAIHSKDPNDSPSPGDRRTMRFASLSIFAAATAPLVAIASWMLFPYQPIGSLFARVLLTLWILTLAASLACSALVIRRIGLRAGNQRLARTSKAVSLLLLAIGISIAMMICSPFFENAITLTLGTNSLVPALRSLLRWSFIVCAVLIYLLGTCTAWWLRATVRRVRGQRQGRAAESSTACSNVQSKDD